MESERGKENTNVRGRERKEIGKVKDTEKYRKRGREKRKKNKQDMEKEQEKKKKE
jgi:hypothetical protein